MLTVVPLGRSPSLCHWNKLEHDWFYIVSVICWTNSWRHDNNQSLRFKSKQQTSGEVQLADIFRTAVVFILTSLNQLRNTRVGLYYYSCENTVGPLLHQKPQLHSKDLRSSVRSRVSQVDTSCLPSLTLRIIV